MTSDKSANDKPTIGEAAGLVPAAKLAEVEDARLKEAARNTQLQEDLDIKIGMVANLEADIAKEQKDRAAAEKAAKYAESECVKAKGEEAGHRREEARLEKANDALSQEVDQLRQKGSDLWESLTTSHKVRDEAVKRSEALQVEMDEARVELEDALEIAADWETKCQDLSKSNRNLRSPIDMLERIYDMAVESLEPESFGTLEAVFVQLSDTRKIGWKVPVKDEDSDSVEAPDPK